MTGGITLCSGKECVQIQFNVVHAKFAEYEEQTLYVCMCETGDSERNVDAVDERQRRRRERNVTEKQTETNVCAKLQTVREKRRKRRRRTHTNDNMNEFRDRRRRRQGDRSSREQC